MPRNRLIRLSPSGPLTGIGVGTIDAMALLRVQNGTTVKTMDVRDLWSFEVGVTLTPDGITTVQGIGGVWVRQLVADPSWSRQPGWWINAVTGSDRNLGDDPARALATAEELVRRIDNQTLSQATTVHQMTALQEWPKLNLKFADSVADDECFRWLGEGVTELHAGVLSGVTPAAPNTNVPQKIADGALVWTPLVGQRVRLKDGASANATAWVAKDEGAGVARVSNFQIIDPSSPSTNPAIVLPSAGNAYAVEQLPSLFGLDIRVSRLTTSASIMPPGVIVDSIDFGGGLASPLLGQIFIEASAFNTTAMITRCRMGVKTLTSGTQTLLFEQGCCAPLSTAVQFTRAGQIAVVAGLTIGNWGLGNFSYHKIAGYHLVQGGQLRCNGLIDVNGGVQIFDCPTDAVVVFDADAQLVLSQTAASPVAGSNNAGSGIRVWGGNNIQHFGTIPTITGSTPGTNDLTLCNTAPTNFSWAAVAAAANKSVADATRLTGFVQR